MTTLSHLECTHCHKKLDPAAGHSLCDCGGPLVARYDLAATRLSWSREWLAHLYEPTRSALLDLRVGLKGLPL